MNALVPSRAGRDAPLVRLAAAGVAAVVRIDGFDPRTRLVWYIVQLGTVNGEVRGHVVGTFADGEQVELGRLSVAGGTIGESRFAISLRGPRFAHVYVDLRADDLALRLEAPPFAGPHRSRALLSGAACIAAGALVASGGVLALAFPRPPIVAAPPYVAAGQTAHVAYATRGIGSARYAAARDDGRVLAAGTLRSAHGDIALTVPRSWARRHVRVRIDVAGPLGRATRDVALAVVPPVAMIAAAPAPPPPAPARIASFVARRERAEDARSVLASYLAVGDRGAIVVSDEKNRVVARAAFSRGGTTRVPLAKDLDRATLTVALDVRRGDSRARSAVVLPPLGAAIPRPVAVVADEAAPPSADAAPASADDPPESTAAASAAAQADDDPFAVTGKAVAGRPMTIAIRRVLPEMHMRLTDDIGNAVAEVAVPPDATRVTLTPPAATSARTYYLTCAYGSGHAQEVVVRSVRVWAP